MTTSNTTTSLPLPPGSFGLPLIGETIPFLKDPNFTEKRYKKYGSLFKTHIFGRPTLIVTGAEGNRFLFSNDHKYFSNNWPYSTRILLGPASLSVQKGTEHQNRRKLLSQAFQPRALTSYASTMEQITHQYLDRWEKLATFAWYPELRNYTLDIACKLLVGVDCASQTQLGEWYKIWVNGLFTLPINLPWTNFGKALRCRKLLLAEIEKIVHQRQETGNSYQDVLELLLQAEDEEGKRLSLNELKDQLLTLLFAGHETLTSALASLCLLLVQNPEVLATARSEQQQLGVDTPLTSENLKQMTYLDQVLKEVMRLIPPVGGGFREVIQSCEFNGFRIPQGWSVLYQVGKTHTDKSVYNHPEVFDPERFSPQRAEDKPKPFSYIPFGGGVRECLGKEFAKLEMKIFAALLLRHYHWELLPEQNLEMIMVPTPHPQDGLKVSFKRFLS
ncbi:cytochrome P450 [Fischerella thermalis CCMEE 5205]|uniref:Cytochrome P450 n=1 Tax=Fischerella thermalis CCMEE 5318 TaxID=2019666 RepID=A0A2N6L9Z9_9CYAN|nr:cytochrome P450 [Fischerella thermalis]PMB19199.1 cytochrome P450 [Fischerella thermalis CCMEE 5318]PMB40821.1 cytochrome P450 [Fischerella thermalis CCMEE 5319]PMB49084.1 cytochrome P450 [Fischerella thermalis CCMEE 5205]